MRKLFLKASCLFAALFLTTTALAQTPPTKPKQAPQALRGKVDLIYEGNRFVLENYNVILWGVKAPKAGTAEAEQALSTLTTLIEHQNVYCVISDALEDAFSARCATNHFDDLGFAMVESGYADIEEVTLKSHPFGQYYISARNSAKDLGYGIWKAEFEARQQAEIATKQAETPEEPKETAAKPQIAPPPISVSDAIATESAPIEDVSTDADLMQEAVDTSISPPENETESSELASSNPEGSDTIATEQIIATDSTDNPDRAEETPTPLLAEQNSVENALPTVSQPLNTPAPPLLQSPIFWSGIGFSSLCFLFAMGLFWSANRLIARQKIYGHSISVNDLGHLTGRYGLLQKPEAQQPNHVLLPMDLLRDIFTYDLSTYKLGASSQTYGAQSLKELDQAARKEEPPKTEIVETVSEEEIPSFLSTPIETDTPAQEQTSIEENAAPTETKADKPKIILSVVSPQSSDKKTLEAHQEPAPKRPEEVDQRVSSGESPLRVWREYRGYTLEIASQKAGISKAYLSQIETGKKNGSVKTLQALAKALEIDLSEITDKVA